MISRFSAILLLGLAACGEILRVPPTPQEDDTNVVSIEAGDTDATPAADARPPDADAQDLLKHRPLDSDY